MKTYIKYSLRKMQSVGYNGPIEIVSTRRGPRDNYGLCMKLPRFHRVLLLILLGILPDTAGAAPSGTSSEAHFVGRASCAPCHAVQDNLWKGSAHDRAMDEANGKTVLADFNNTSFTYFGVTSKFFKKGSEYHVITDGPDGKLTDYRVKYVFGYFPLQQYLLDFGNGFYQALNVVWDTRTKEEGGQRWFHLYPNEEVRFNDPLHWTKRLQTWNYTCAECHSTNLRKNFDPVKRNYSTTWSEIDVSCETCHGPGSKHVAWADAQRRSGGKLSSAPKISDDPDKGLEVRLEKPLARPRVFGADGISRLVDPKAPRIEQLETCARCHSRRVQIREPYADGKPLLDGYRVDLLGEHYHPDGQIKDEVYEYGSFLQSKMYKSGVVCSDCHDPHSTKRFVLGNGLCARCHLPAKYDSPAHHFHKQDGPGADCMACHAPKTAYMGVDRRADHSFRIPRPDLNDAIQSADACSSCHSDKPLQWSRDAFVKWFGPRGYTSVGAKPHYGQVIKDGRLGKPGSGEELQRLADDESMPEIVRATAVSMLGGYPADRFAAGIARAVQSNERLIRFGAARALEGLSPPVRLKLAVLLAGDPLLAIREEAAASMVPFLQERSKFEQAVSPQGLAALDRALKEYESSLVLNSDTAASLCGRASLAIYQGDPSRADGLLKEAITLEPYSQLSYINLADLYRSQGKEREAEDLLRKASDEIYDSAEAKHSLGLSLVRQRRYNEALKYLAEAAKMRPQLPEFQYVYAVALESAGKTIESASIVAEALKQHPYNENLLGLTLSGDLKVNNLKSAMTTAELLKSIDPLNPEYQALIDRLKTAR